MSAKLSPIPDEDAAQRRDPQVPARVLGNGVDPILREPLGGTVDGDGRAVISVQPRLRPDPEISRSILIERLHSGL